MGRKNGLCLACVKGEVIEVEGSGGRRPCFTRKTFLGTGYEYPGFFFFSIQYALGTVICSVKELLVNPAKNAWVIITQFKEQQVHCRILVWVSQVLRGVPEKPFTMEEKPRGALRTAGSPEWRKCELQRTYSSP